MVFFAHDLDHLGAERCTKQGIEGNWGNEESEVTLLKAGKPSQKRANGAIFGVCIIKSMKVARKIQKKDFLINFKQNYLSKWNWLKNTQQRLIERFVLKWQHVPSRHTSFPTKKKTPPIDNAMQQFLNGMYSEALQKSNRILKNSDLYVREKLALIIMMFSALLAGNVLDKHVAWQACSR